jgi:hypothetical protein
MALQSNAVEAPKLIFRKYQAISVEGPTEARNGKNFFKCLFEEDASDNGGYSSQSRGYVKIFFDDTHSLIFAKCEKHMANEATPVRIMAGKEKVKVAPYYMYDKDGNEMINQATGKPAIGEKLSIFLLPDEDVEGEIRRRSRNLKFVDIDELDDNEEEEKKEAEATKTKKK